MHSPHATWETGLVIPEATKTTEEQMLAALLRIEKLLVQLNSRFAPGHTDLMVEPEAIDDFTSEELQEIQQVRETTKPPKGKRK
jgi:glyoxylase-like metal-dependent hydrolase (beta-lactamase superfamily II)